MANSVPAVGFDVGGIGEWLKHGKTGLLVGRYDVNAMAYAINEMVTDMSKNKAMEAAGRAVARTGYGMDDHMGRLIDILEVAGSAI